MKRLIENVVCLDMTNTKPEDVEDVTIDNAVNVFVTPETRHLLNKINFGNLVNVVEIPEKVSINTVNGSLFISGNQDQPDNSLPTTTSTYNLINGRVIIGNQISPETFKRTFLHGGMINGSIILPETISSLIAASNLSINGKQSVYPAESILFNGNININNGFLRGLGEDSTVTVFGDIIIASDTEIELFETAITQLYVFGDVLMSEHISQSFYKAARKYNDITAVPDDYIYTADTIIISSTNILSYRNKKLYTMGNVILKNDLTEEKLSQNSFSIKAKGIVICPDAISLSVVDKIAGSQFHTYDGSLVIIEGSYMFNSSELEGKEKLIFVINGEMNITKDISPDLLNKSISDIFVYGTINLTKEQLTVINSKIRFNKGDINSDEDDEVIASVNKKDEYLNYDIIIPNAVHYVL